VQLGPGTPSAPTLSVFDQLTGQNVGGFVVGECLAQGGMGYVYRAAKPGSDQPLAIKVMQAELGDDATARKRFLREMSLLQTLDHPNIIRIFASGEDRDLLYFVMPLVRGPSLSELLTRRRFSPVTAWQIVYPLALALDYAHSHGVIHRDVKPGNVLIDAGRDVTSRVYLVDFGISKVKGASALTRSGISMGTPYYIAPEQVLGQELTPRSDIYSLAVMTYQMLLGRLPFQGRLPQDVALKHVYAEPPTLTSLQPDFPPILNDVIMRGLAKNPADRFASAGEFCAAYSASMRQTAPQARAVEYAARA
jgi:serine/threonine-protein kinase